jgi:hypothetical protein
MREFGDWQEMARAPRDGTRVLVEVKASEQGAAEVDIVRWAKIGSAAEAGWVSTESDAAAPVFYAEAELSGWMALPSLLPGQGGRRARSRGAGSRDDSEVDGSGI